LASVPRTPQQAQESEKLEKLPFSQRQMVIRRYQY